MQGASQYNVNAQPNPEAGSTEHSDHEEPIRTTEAIKKDLLELIPSELKLDAQMLFRELWATLSGGPEPQSTDAITATIRDTILECLSNQTQQPL